jgi:hypothetical protein
MNNSPAEKSMTLPAVQITPAAVKRLAKKYRIGLTEDDAARWLVRHKSLIEKKALWATQKQIDDVLLDVTLIDWPEPKFDRMHRRIYDAISNAIVEYEKRKNLEDHSDAWDAQEMAKLVHRFLRYQGKKPIAEFLVVEVGFAEHGAPLGCGTPGTPYVFELVYDKPKVTAKLAHRL